MDHSHWVQISCRVCGGRLARYKQSYDCQTSSSQAKLKAIGISVEGDEKTVHPQKFCHGCYNVCVRMLTAKEHGRDYTPTLTKFPWTEHTDSCMVCQHFERTARGGRKPKRTSAGRPPDLVVDLVTAIKERAPPSIFHDQEMRARLSHHQSIDAGLKCPLCHLVVDRPITLVPCNNLVCLTCCTDHLFRHTDLSCPCCGTAHQLDITTTIPASPVIQNLLVGLEIPCDQCQQPVLAGKLIQYTY